MKYSVIITVVLIMLFSCAEKSNITITKEYIQNEFWKEKRVFREVNGIPVNEIQLLKLKVKDSISLEEQSLRYYVDNNLLEIDTINKEQNYWAWIPRTEGIKIYFNKDYDDWFWFCYKTDEYGMRIPDDNCTKRNIGELKNNTWYLFNRIRPEGIYDNAYLVYIYVDENGKTHKFIRNLINI